MMDYINEANSSYPTIPQVGGNNWRAMPDDMNIFRWEYVATTDLEDSKGMYIKIFLENDIPFSGSHAVATIYARSEDE